MGILKKGRWKEEDRGNDEGQYLPMEEAYIRKWKEMNEEQAHVHIINLASATAQMSMNELWDSYYIY